MGFRTADGEASCPIGQEKPYKIPRTYINQCADRIDLEYTGVYFLFGQNKENSERPQVYIGETENILVRLKQHLQDKDFWTECVAFINKDNNLNKSAYQIFGKSFILHRKGDKAV